MSMTIRIGMAIVILTTTKDVPETYFGNIAEPLRFTAVCMQALDQRELKYYLAKQQDFTIDLKNVRQRVKDIQHAPSLDNVYLFPYCQDQIILYVQLNRAYKRHLETMLELYPNDERIVETLKDVDALYRAWDSLRDAINPYYYVTARRMALAKLVELIGQDAFSNGCMPPPVPIWKFTEVR